MGALSKLDEFLLNPQVRTCSVFQGASRTANSESREIHGDRSSTGPYPEGGYFPHHSGQLNSSGADMVTETYPHMVTGATGETRTYPHMVTGATGEFRHYPHMVTGATEDICHNPHATAATQEEIPYCSPTTSSGKQKKASENTPATIEADQILLALQQLATDSNSANFNNNISRISKLPKSLTTTMPTFDGKSEKFELFEDLFQTSSKIHNQLTEEDKINYFHSLMRGDALLSKTSLAPTERIWEKS